MQQGLILESSSNIAGIAITKDHSVVEKTFFSGGFGMSNHFFAFLANRPPSFDYIAAGIGPGAFTGTRVSITIAKTLAHALKTPLISFCSLFAHVPSDEGPFISMFDAKIGGVYLAKGRMIKNDVFFDEPSLYSIDDALPIIKMTPKIVSPDTEFLKKRFKAETEITWTCSSPNMEMLARQCQKKFEKQEFSHLEPIYLREA